ncbi:hypothetical protein HYW20_05055 [Candidatus Woesearchaeota archaeon]|nr:hypothetical protein [Candidatus Woesearchaeota archaeon]
MTQEYLISWGKHAFEKGLSLSHIEDYFLKRGMKQSEALKALHEITAFEHKIHQEAEDIRKDLISIPLLFLLILSGIIFLYLTGVIRVK